MSNNNDLLSNFLKKKSKQNLLTIILILIFLILVICAVFWITSLNNSYSNNDIIKLNKTNSELNANLNNALNSLQIMQTKNMTLQNSYNSIVTELNNLRNEFIGAQKIPYVVMSDRNFEAVFKKINNEIIYWVWPADSFEQSFINGYNTRKSGLQYKRLDFGNGKVVSVIDYTVFVEDKLFNDVIGKLYDSSKSDRKNIEEIVNINNQLVTYSSELTDTPRYSLETLSEGGGDCEDQAILVASMLKSVPKNWKISLVYIDADNPSSPKEVNHVIVKVDNGSEIFSIETTIKNNNLDFYNNVDVVGWFFEV